MSDLSDAAKRLLLGRPVRSDRLGHTLLPKRIALPVFASDALSSVAYAPDEILLTLSLAGMAALVVSPWVGLAVVAVMIVVVASYRQNVHAYPSGGGDYEVATTNLGRNAGVTVASALLVDYVLTVAVSISSAAQYAATALPALRGHEALFAVALVVLLTVANLRGVKESGSLFAIPVYMFMLAIGALAVVGSVQLLTGNLAMAESSGFELAPDAAFDQGLTGLAGFFLILRAFSSGCAALTGVEAISNGVPAFKKPKSKNAATTLALLGSLSIVMIMSILLLSRATGVIFADDPQTQLLRDGVPVGESYDQHPVISQLSDAVFQSVPVVAVLIAVVTGLILFFAANTAFNGFPVLGSILARDGYLPRQLHTRGDRLAFSNGIVTLALAAIVLIWAFDAQVTRLIQLYIVGVFVSFTISQLGMVRHWTRHLRTEPDPAARTRMKRSRIINSVGLGMTGTVLVVVLITKFTHGAWIAILAMIAIYVLMQSIHRHYALVRAELALGTDAEAARALPSRVHAIVLVSHLHRPTMRALAYARASRPQILEAVTVGVDPSDVEVLREQWEEMNLPVPLRVLDSPFREITRPVLTYVRSIRRDSPRDLVVVYIPEYVVGHWWEQLLHNQSALRLKGRLLFTPGVVVASVPWQLASTEGQTGLEDPVRVPFRVATDNTPDLSHALVELEIGPVAHGGHCVARHEGRVIFVRHTLPGERVRARLTDAGETAKFWRADAVEVLEASPDRVDSAWPAAGPGGVGGGELAHVSLPAQRTWKAAVLAEQLRRLAKLDLDVPVQAAPGDDERGGLGWRTRIELVTDAEGRAGMYGFRSHDVHLLDSMPLANEAIAALDLFGRRWSGGARVEAVAPSSGDAPLVLVDGAPFDVGRGRMDGRPNARTAVKEHVQHGEVGYDFRVAGAGFWQVHREAPDLLVAAVLAGLGAVDGAAVLDLYAGAGLFTAPLSDAVGETGEVVSVEGDARAVKDARRNLHDRRNVELHAGDVAQVLTGQVDADSDVVHADAVVLDPPRTGAGRKVVAGITALRPERVVYVACDPAALARDIALFADAGYALADLQAYDLFPMTHHLEAVAVLTR